MPFALIGFIDVLLVTVVGVFWFDVPIRGSLLLLLASTALYLMTTLGVGLLISTVSQTQQQAMMSTFFFYFPAILLSGFMFPIANMPDGRPVADLPQPAAVLPGHRPRASSSRASAPNILWPQMLALAILGLATLCLAGLRFRKTLA